MPAWLIPAITAAASIFGKAGKGASDARQSYNDSVNQSNRNAIDLYGTQQNAQTGAYRGLQDALMRVLEGESAEKTKLGQLDLDRRKFALDAPSARGKQALLGSLLQNLQPAKLEGLNPQIAARMPQISGGLSPAALGPLARQMGGLMQQNAVRGQQQGDQFDPVAPTDFRSGVVDPSRFLLQSPQLQGLKQAGLLEKILGGGGLIGSLIGGIGAARSGGRTPPFIEGDT